MKDHVVSQFYLKGFADPAHPREVWSYPFRERVWSLERPKNIAWEPDYYGETDNALRIAETVTARAVRKARRLEPLSEEDRVALGTFVVMMMGRFPALIDIIGEEARSRSEQRLRERYRRAQEDPSELDRLMEEMTAAGFRPDSPFEVEDLNPARISFKANPSGVALLTLTTAARFLPALLAMSWTFVVSADRDFFVTSDHPFYAIDRTAPPRGMYGFAALSDPNVKATLPLGKHVALYLWRGSPAKVEYRPVDAEAVAELNVRTAWLANRFIAAPSTDFPGSDEVLKLVAGRGVEPRGAGK